MKLRDGGWVGGWLLLVVKDALGYSFVSSMVWGFRVVCWERRSFLLRMAQPELDIHGGRQVASSQGCGGGCVLRSDSCLTFLSIGSDEVNLFSPAPRFCLGSSRPVP